MATLAEDFAYWLVNPVDPYMTGDQMYERFWSLADFVDMLYTAGLQNHPDIGVSTNAQTIWNLVEGQTHHGIKFISYSDVDPCQPCAKMYMARRV